MVKIKITTNTKYAASVECDYIELDDKELKELEQSKGHGYEICKEEAIQIQGFEWAWEIVEE